ncbi:MAG: hypothetical protein Q9195_003877 [Heterodermia aff. obscurata]
MPPSRALSGALKPLSASPIRPRTASNSIQLQSSTSQSRAFSAHPVSSTDTGHSSSHSDQYDPPSGWLYNVPPGEKYKNEGWEALWVWGVWGSIGATVVAYAYKPDTSIQTWALEEARRRLEAEGILPDSSADGPEK